MEFSPLPLAAFALYQLSLIVGIVMLPLALLARRAGVQLPIHRVVLSLKGTYTRTTSA